MSTVSFCKLQWWITAQKMKFSIKDFFSKCVQIRRTKSYLSNAILAKTQDFTMNGRHVLWKTEILLYTVEICYERSRLYDDRSRYVIAGPDFVMKRSRFHDGRSKFYCEWWMFLWWQLLEILLWTLEIFMMAARDFVKKSRDFIMNGRDFKDDWSIFS